MAFSVTSAALADGQLVPEVHTCDGEDLSPPLAWADPPRGTRAFALVVDDPDAPGGVFTHWMLADIPEATRAVERDEPLGVLGTNDFGKAAWGGPCPPRGHGRHRYRFQVHALSRPLRLKRGFSRRQFDAALADALLASAMLTAYYERNR
ncbi:MAG: YbhB/YbcL family Raf kinase inhibitor-like protein [Acidobacteria bacterium]|nr:YbhB/YbcL family Raf kinase inhibitor-like protein [Acidobacteriota bacterium]